MDGTLSGPIGGSIPGSNHAWMHLHTVLACGCERLIIVVHKNAGSVSPSPRFAMAKWGEAVPIIGWGEVFVFILCLCTREQLES
jgi:hypothetical protein